jgi:hypothetical protein
MTTQTSVRLTSVSPLPPIAPPIGCKAPDFFCSSKRADRRRLVRNLTYNEKELSLPPLAHPRPLPLQLTPAPSKCFLRPRDSQQYHSSCSPSSQSYESSSLSLTKPITSHLTRTTALVAFKQKELRHNASTTEAAKDGHCRQQIRG